MTVSRQQLQLGASGRALAAKSAPCVAQEAQRHGERVLAAGEFSGAHSTRAQGSVRVEQLLKRTKEWLSDTESAPR